MPEISNLSEDKLQEAYRAWTKYHISLRELESRFGVPKSSLQRAFGKLKKTEGLFEIAGEEAGGESELVTADPEIQHLESEVTALKRRIQRVQKVSALREKKKELQEKALEVDAQLAVAKIVDSDHEQRDLSKLVGYIETVVYQDDSRLVRRFWKLTEELGMSEENAVVDSFPEPFEVWAIEQSEDVKFEHFVTYHLRKWISIKEELLEEEQERAEEEEKLAEEKRRQELEEELREVMPRLRCPLCRRGGRITSYTIVKEGRPLSAGVYFRCADCLLYYSPRWIIHPFGQDEVELYHTPFARVPSRDT